MDNSIQSFLIAVLPLQTAYNMENLLFQEPLFQSEWDFLVHVEGVVPSLR